MDFVKIDVVDFYDFEDAILSNPSPILQLLLWVISMHFKELPHSYTLEHRTGSYKLFRTHGVRNEQDHNNKKLHVWILPRNFLFSTSRLFKPWLIIAAWYKHVKVIGTI